MSKYCGKCGKELKGKEKYVCDECVKNAIEEILPRTKDSIIIELKQQLAEKDKEIAELKANQTPTDKELNPQEYDNYNLADKLRYRGSQIRIAMDRLQKLEEENEHLDKHNTELAYALTEKPKQHELYELRLDNEILKEDRDNYVKAKLKEQCHQICKEIREWCEQNEFEVEHADQSSNCAVYTYTQLFKKLDKIEKGE